VTFLPDEFKELNISNPRVWWTYDLGKPELYNLHLSFKERNTISDEKNVHFGIREVSDYINEKGFRGYKLNGKKILIRGGGWVDQILLDNTFANLKAQIEYAKHMNLNTLRFEGFWGSSEDIYNLCDETGILIMVGWSCQWEWEAYIGKPHDDNGAVCTPADMRLLADSWIDQIKWLRNHPAIFLWLYGSDKFPRPELEQEYLKILSEDDSTRPSLASAAGRVSSITGKSFVKMRGPYDYEPPSYWYVDTLYGGAFGLNTETGPGPQVPVIESVKKFIPQDHLWPIDSVWYFHCGGNDFKDLKRYNDAMNDRLGAAKNLDEYCTKAQFLNYEGMRAMYEAFVANKYKATGIIQWMYNSAWPKFWWQFYDYYLMPTAALYGARKACEPVHILYDYGNNSIEVVNNTVIPQQDYKAEVKVFNFDLSKVFTNEKTVSLQPDEKYRVASLDGVKNLDTTYFVDLRLYNGKHQLVSSNFYCLSTKEEILDYSKNTWFVTPTKQLADLTKLNSLTQVNLEIKAYSIYKKNRVEI
jgi:exo-1,4-beta-D-glucosaminidase